MLMCNSKKISIPDVGQFQSFYLAYVAKVEHFSPSYLHNRQLLPLAVSDPACPCVHLRPWTHCSLSSSHSLTASQPAPPWSWSPLSYGPISVARLRHGHHSSHPKPRRKSQKLSTSRCSWSSRCPRSFSSRFTGQRALLECFFFSGHVSTAEST